MEACFDVSAIRVWRDPHREGVRRDAARRGGYARRPEGVRKNARLLDRGGGRSGRRLTAESGRRASRHHPRAKASLGRRRRPASGARDERCRSCRDVEVRLRVVALEIERVLVAPIESVRSPSVPPAFSEKPMSLQAPESATSSPAAKSAIWPLKPEGSVRSSALPTPSTPSRSRSSGRSRWSCRIPGSSFQRSRRPLFRSPRPADRACPR